MLMNPREAWIVLWKMECYGKYYCVMEEKNGSINYFKIGMICGLAKINFF